MRGFLYVSPKFPLTCVLFWSEGKQQQQQKQTHAHASTPLKNYAGSFSTHKLLYEKNIILYFLFEEKKSS